MEGNNKQNDSSSFVYELFGPKETHSSSSSGVLGSMSSQSPNVLGKEPVLSEVSEKTIKERWDTILGSGTHGSISKGYGGEFHKTQTKDRMSSIYQDQRIEPCNLSSSIFYGGQDIIHHVQSTQNERKNLLVFGRESVRYQAKGKTVKETLGTNSGTQADLWKSNGNESQIVRAEDLCSIFKVPRIEPCNNIWSSIFDVGSTQNAGFTSRPNNYWENDDSGASSLGDWWNGGPHYS